MYIAYMHFDYRHLALFDRIAERHGRVAVASCVEDDAGVWVIGYLTCIICLLEPIYEVALMVGLLIDEMHVEPISLDLQQNLCHRPGAVYFRLAFSQTIQVRTIKNKDLQFSILNYQFTKRPGGFCTNFEVRTDLKTLYRTL